MNFAIYQAFARIPMGIAVTIEFLGPLAVSVAGALAGARRAAGLGCAALAAAGVLLLAQGSGGHLNLAGIAFSLLSAAGWAGYIVASRASGQQLPGNVGLVIAMGVAAIGVTGPGLAAGGAAMFRPSVLLTGAAIGLLSSLIPYGLEFQALRRVPARVFGVWMSLQPAVAAVIGLLLLSQRLSPAEWAGVACVAVASAGAAQGSAAQGSAAEDSAAPGGAARETAPVQGNKELYSMQPMPTWIKPAVTWLDKTGARLLWGTRDRVRRWTLVTVIANAVVICTGAAVRLTDSGLGCPDWPKCTQTSLVAAHAVGQTTLNSWIEFGNRLLNGPLSLILGLVFIACLMYREDGHRRKDLMWLALIQPLGVPAQAVAGGITVLTRLNPAMVSLHFLLSAGVMLPAALVLHVRAGEGGGPVRLLVRGDLRVMAALLTGASAVMLAAGTVVTGTGPLAGTTTDSHGHLTTVPRYHFNLDEVTQLHADVGWFILALAVALAIGLHFADGAPRAAVRDSRIVVGWVFAQGIIGYVQYFTRLPAGLVWVHVASAVVLWVFVLRLYLSTRVRLPAGIPASADPAAGAEAGADAALASDAR
jgi:cytochrome c oxidase assembly protein subunit 15